MAAAEPTMDMCNFPELLVRDLDIQSVSFTSKNMTAGAPTLNLAFEEQTWQAAEAPQDPLPSPSVPQPIVRFRSSTTHERRTSSLSGSSLASDESTSEAEPTCLRHHSVLTDATTVSNGIKSILSQKRRDSIGHDTNASWLDFEPEPEHGDDLALARAKLPRASTATGHRQSTDHFGNSAKPPTRTWSLQLHHQQRFGEGGLPLESIEVIVPQRRSSLRNQLTPRLAQEVTKKVELEQESTKPEVPAIVDNEGFSLEDTRDDIEPWFRYGDQSKEDIVGKRSTRITRQRPQPISPPSPTVNVQTWLEDSLESPISEEQGRRMRLPPEIMETLRVSTSCFPETMLLCSSLSVETIRSYSRKMRHPAAEEPAKLQTPPQSPKRWKWTSVLGHRRSVASLKTREASSQRQALEPEDSGELAVAPLASSAATTQWSRLKNIFPMGSDYLLDALYAHLVVYLYVSSLCPRHKASTSLDVNRVPASPARSSMESRRKSKDSNDIPRKAATLLGLPNAAGETNVPPSPTGSGPWPAGRLVRKKSSFMDGMRASRMPLPAQADASAVRDLQVSLAGCIARLVATLRASPADEDELALLAEEDVKADIDPLLIRTLGEIVRCCEEAA